MKPSLTTLSYSYQINGRASARPCTISGRDALLRVRKLTHKTTHFFLVISVGIILASASLRQSAAQDVIPLTFDQPLTGQVTADVFRQIYSFSSRRADVIALNMTTSAGTLDPLLILTDGQGTPLIRSTGQGQPLHAA